MKSIFSLLVVSVLSASFGLSTAAAEITASGDVYVGVADKYLWRGFDLSPDSDFVVQPGVDVSIGNFTASYWSNYDEDSAKVNETDITLDYSFDINELISMSVGNIYYELEGADDTNELYLSASFNTLLSPAVTLYWDWDEADEAGLYLTAEIGHTFALAEGVGLNLGALISYNGESDYAVGDYSDFHNGELSLSLDWEPCSNVVVSPAVIYSVPLSDDADDVIDDELMVGLTVAYNF